MLQGSIDIKSPFLAGVSLEITGRIAATRTGIGFKPATLTMTIYDVNPGGTGAVDTVYVVNGIGVVEGPVIVSAIVNAHQGTDVLDLCDLDGNLQIFLTPEDTAATVSPIVIKTPLQRRILLTWTWGDPVRTAKSQITIRIVPDHATVAVAA